jgi:ankyrin repeat protein
MAEDLHTTEWVKPWVSIQGITRCRVRMGSKGAEARVDPVDFSLLVLLAILVWTALTETGRDLVRGLVAVFGRAKNTIGACAANGDSAGVEALLKDGGDPNETDWLDHTPLHRAAENGHTGVIELLASRGADLNAVDSNQFTPLFYAMARNRILTGQALVRLGAEPNFGPCAVSPLESALAGVMLNANVTGGGGQFDLAIDLVKAGADPNPDLDWSFRETPLHYAAAGHVELTKALLDAGAAIDAQDVRGFTPLHKAVILEQPEIIELLLSAGADSSVISKSGKTPAGVASKRFGRSHADLMKTLS